MTDCSQYPGLQPCLDNLAVLEADNKNLASCPEDLATCEANVVTQQELKAVCDVEKDEINTFVQEMQGENSTCQSTRGQVESTFNMCDTARAQESAAQQQELSDRETEFGNLKTANDNLDNQYQSDVSAIEQACAENRTNNVIPNADNDCKIQTDALNTEIANCNQDEIDEKALLAIKKQDLSDVKATLAAKRLLLEQAILDTGIAQGEYEFCLANPPLGENLAACEAELEAVKTNASALYYYTQIGDLDSAGNTNTNPPTFTQNTPIGPFTLEPTLLPSPSVATFNSTPDLPPGMYLTENGSIAGTPTVDAPEQVYKITLDPVGSAPGTVVPLLTVYARFAVST